MTSMHLAPDVRAEFDQQVAATADREQTPSLVAAVVAGGDVVHAVAAGSGAAPPGAGTASVFRIASMTKSFTAAAVLLLRDEARLALDDPVETHVPLLGSLTPPGDAPPVTIRQLLTMASGLATDDAWADRHLDDDRDAMDALFARGATFAHPPGITMEYSNYGYAMLGRVVETATGTSCSSFVTERFLRPLGMHSTVWEPAAALAAGLDVVAPFRLVDGVPAADTPAALGDGGFAPMGGLWSSVDDLARWVGFLCDAFPPRDDCDELPLRRSSRRELQQAHRSYRSPVLHHAPGGRLRQIGIGYGMGLQRAHHLDMGAVVNHSGGLPGYGSNMRWLPDRGVGVVALANLTYAPMAALTYDLLELLGDLGALPAPRPVESPFMRPAAERLVALLNDWDDARAAEFFADNVLPDEPADRRARAAADLIAANGRLQLVSIDNLSATEADAMLESDQGKRIRLELQLAPTVPPLIQWYEATVDNPATT